MKVINAIERVIIFFIFAAFLYATGCASTSPRGKQASNEMELAPAPTNVTAAVLSHFSNRVDWSGKPPFFAVQRRTASGQGWTQWETIDSKDTGTQHYNDPYAPINEDTEYRIGSWNDDSTPPTDSQWSDPSNVVNNPG
jgi:hypothetical protein